jgi:thioredoxin 1
MVRHLEANEKNPAPADGTAVVAFSAKWCPPCKIMDPIFESVSAQFPALEFLKANQEAVPGMFEEYSVQSIPTYLVFKEGKEIHRQVGAMPASRFQAMLEKFAA